MFMLYVSSSDIRKKYWNFKSVLIDQCGMYNYDLISRIQSTIK